MTTVAEAGELAVLEALRGVFVRRDPRVLLGIGDDAAILAVQGHLVATVDSVEADVDWIAGATPRDAIGHRAAAVNLSDLAAMGARPLGLLVALELPGDAAIAEVVQSARGLAALADRFGAAVVGGDIGVGAVERWSVTALGTLRGPALRRDAARPGDRVWLVGDIGRAALGLEHQRARLRSEGASEALRAAIDACVDAHLRPEPLIAEGMALAATGARVAAIDISDGLLLDAERLAAASSVRLELHVPRPAWLTDEVIELCERSGSDWPRLCACGGDDYALLVCAEPDLEVDGRLIGRVSAGEGVSLRVAGHPVSGQGGYLHGGPAGKEHAR